MVKKVKRVFLFYPPGELYQRGEDRSQGNIKQSTATVMRAPNDMGYVAAQLKQRQINVCFFDYASMKNGIPNLLEDIKKFKPDVIITSVTTSTLINDLKILKKIRNIFPAIKIITKGAVFFNASNDRLDSFDLSAIDYLVGGEIEFSAARIIDYINGEGKFEDIPGIFYRTNGKWNKTLAEVSVEDVDNLPFPDRSVINNSLYIRPDTGEAQATISTSRGCPASCIYCLTPIISGKAVRFRRPELILEELKDCYYNHSIKNFFFKSDTFTINHDWVEELCSLIISSDLKGKIEWVANSRVRPLKQETLKIMKEAGCWLVAFGFETGSEETMHKIKKGATVQDNVNAMKLMHLSGLKSYGFFLVGLPWENEKHLKDTKKHIFELQPDFVEIHIALPYYETPLHELSKKDGLLTSSIVGQNYFDETSNGTNFLSAGHLNSWRKKTLIQYHLQPRYLWRRLKEIFLDIRKLKAYTIFGFRLLKNT